MVKFHREHHHSQNSPIQVEYRRLQYRELLVLLLVLFWFQFPNALLFDVSKVQPYFYILFRIHRNCILYLHS